jgi:hypothetical protein
MEENVEGAPLKVASNVYNGEMVVKVGFDLLTLKNPIL